jgi:hypothetical protein
MAEHFFRDRRTGTVYKTTERELPTSGRVPLKAAYREDTVWVDRDHLDSVADPHEMTGGRATGIFAIFIFWTIASVFTVLELCSEYGLSPLHATLLTAGNWFILILWSAKTCGLLHS